MEYGNISYDIRDRERERERETWKIYPTKRYKIKYKINNNNNVEYGNISYDITDRGNEKRILKWRNGVQEYCLRHYRQRKRKENTEMAKWSREYFLPDITFTTKENTEMAKWSTGILPKTLQTGETKKRILYVEYGLYPTTLQTFTKRESVEYGNISYDITDRGNEKQWPTWSTSVAYGVQVLQWCVPAILPLIIYTEFSPFPTIMTMASVIKQRTMKCDPGHL